MFRVNRNGIPCVVLYRESASEEILIHELSHYLEFLKTGDLSLLRDEAEIEQVANMLLEKYSKTRIERPGLRSFRRTSIPSPMCG